MRTLEWIYLIFNVVMLVWLIGGRNKPRRMVWGGLVISSTLWLMHGVVEGLRWPMIPGYLLTLVPLIVLIAGARREWKSGADLDQRSHLHDVVSMGEAPSRTTILPGSFSTSAQVRKFGRVRIIGTSLLVLVYAAVTIGLPLLFPVFSFDKPTGPYGIGTVSYDWTDESREELLTSTAGDKRELMVQIWYPTDQDTKGTTAPVSQGYIVVGINHTYSSLVSVFPDGRVAQFESEGKEGFDQLQFSYMDKLNETWVKDAQFVLDEVEKLAANDANGRFNGHMDLDNIGMFGHSFGGATTVQMLMDDPRVKAGMNMDGVLFGEKRIPAGGVGKPFLMMSADTTVAGTSVMSDDEIAAMGTTRPEAEKYYEGVYARYELVTAGGNYWMELSQTKHLSFSDLYLISPILEWSQGVDAKGAHQIVNDTTIDFFNHYLKGQPLQLDSEVGEHPSYSLKKG
ncbi:hypothetical protein JNUCC31_19045 [Paenibacillus sp. JNUCC31]|uniref:alpha/beta hydrolase family protein n=1 Tax=Paenibacillus sp. JNUCC-31 TaxID=2777983 RepID=UPI00177B77AD|nr:hypothetical protein [Paenibacillus sp. JNUCC-31]QOS76923.1 hypothetical protein JNUCC31_19045 [Paenibacillus sp. JNUCC-31]